MVFLLVNSVICLRSLKFVREMLASGRERFFTCTEENQESSIGLWDAQEDHNCNAPLFNLFLSLFKWAVH